MAYKNSGPLARGNGAVIVKLMWDIWFKSSEDIPGIPRWLGAALKDPYVRSIGFDARSKNWKKCQQCIFIEQSNRICGGWK
jgi:hypothetical protein